MPHKSGLRRRQFVGLPAALALLLGAPRIALSQERQLTMATEYPHSTVSGEGVAFFAGEVAAESRQHLEIKPSYDADLGLKSSDILGAISAGRLAAGCAFGGALGGVDPLFLLSSLPFVATTETAAHRLFDEAKPVYVRHFAHLRQRLLYATPWPASGLWAKKPIITPADIAGLRLRVYDATGVAVFKAAGAEPVNLSFAQAGPRLTDGSLDAVLSSGDGGAGRRLWEHLPYFTEIGYAMPLSFATFGDASYEGLTPDLRATVDHAAATTQTEQWRRLGKRIAENRDRLQANKVTITPSDGISDSLKSLLVSAASGAVSQWKREAGPDASALLR